MKILRIFLGPQEKVSYEQSLKYYRDLNNVIETAFVEGKVEGRFERKAEGLAEGEAKGEVKGRAEERRELAKGMKAQGLDPKLISKITGLSAENIEALS